MSNLAINLSSFSFQESYNVRTAIIDNYVWFLANDVCAILGYSNPRKAISDHCKAKGVTKRDTPTKCDVTNRYGTSTARKSQEMTYIDEPNLYRLTTKSKMPNAEKFEEWVFEIVLPTIRKTGSYSVIDKSNYITDKQLNDLKMIVNNISTAYFYQDSFIQGIWKMMRDVTGADSIQHITKDKFYLLKPQIEKMLAVTRMYFDLRKDTEVAIVKEIFRGHVNEDVVIFNVKHKHAQFIANLNKNHLVKLDNFSKKLLSELN